MVGPYGDWVKYALEEAALLAAELDGVRLLGSCRHELLRRVPDALADVFRVGSTAPGALPARPFSAHAMRLLLMQGSTEAGP